MSNVKKEISREFLVESLNNGKSYNKIAKEVGVVVQTVINRVREYGIKRIWS